MRYSKVLKFSSFFLGVALLLVMASTSQGPQAQMTIGALVALTIASVIVVYDHRKKDRVDTLPESLRSVLMPRPKDSAVVRGIGDIDFSDIKPPGSTAEKLGSKIKERSFGIFFRLD
jgi:hypothetical protein